MSQHTPGPWTWEPPNGIPADGYDARVLGAENGYTVGWVRPHNARLIAAAPDLLAVLERICRAQERCAGDNPLDALIDEARAAIAKAKA
jgi:hypothetical protein